ncbi:hypothetical protein BGX28_005471 [Mortierella sp. GBA30]|nr:hypothetical protein BGX28_005471 [Mortierella sp. GBA30]
MFKRLGLQAKDRVPSSSSTPTSTLDTKLMDQKEKKKAHHNKKVLRSSTSYDSLESTSIAPQPHLPSSIYSPNPFPLDPTQPDGISRNNVFTRQERETKKEFEIEIEETKGFVSGKSRQSVEGQQQQRQHEEIDLFDEESEYELAMRTNHNAIQKLGAGLKGAFVKTGLGLGMGRDKNIDNEERKDVDAVLLHHQQQQQKCRDEIHSLDPEKSVRPITRGRDQERQRTQSGPLYPARGQDRHGVLREDEPISRGSNQGSRVNNFSDKRSDLRSLSPPLRPPTSGHEQRDSASYWPEGHRGLHSELQEQMSPFLGYQPPPHAPSGRSRPHQQHRSSRPLSLVSDPEYRGYSHQSYEQRIQSRERYESGRRRRETFGAGSGSGSGTEGVQRQSGLNRVANVAPSSSSSVPRSLSSEPGDDEATSTSSQQNTREIVPDRLSRAKEWVANHSRNNSIAVPAPVMDRERAVLSSLPGSFPSSRPGHRLSMDSEGYGQMTPSRSSYLERPGGGPAGYDAHERVAMMTQMQMQERSRNYRDSMGDDGRYWEHQLEGYERDRYRQTRMEYDYDGRGGFYGYARGGPDEAGDEDEAESTLAPGSAVGGITKPKKALDLGGAIKKEGIDTKSAPTATAAVSNTEQEELQELTSPKVPNKRRLILRLISLASSFLVLVFLIAASPVSQSSSPFTSQAGIVFHYVVGILSILISFAFVFNYFSRRLRRQEKMKRYVLFGLDVFMTLLWLIDIFVCITKFPCAVGGQSGWCDMYNSSIFLGMVAFASFLAAFIWDIWGSFDHPKSSGGSPWIRPPPPGFDGKSVPKPVAMPAGWSGGRRGGPGGVGAGQWPGTNAWPGQIPGQPMPGVGPMKPKNSKALW